MSRSVNARQISPRVLRHPGKRRKLTRQQRETIRRDYLRIAKLLHLRRQR